MFGNKKKRSEICRTPPARLQFPTKIRLFSLFVACLEEGDSTLSLRTHTSHVQDSKRCTEREKLSTNNHDIALTIASNGDDDEESMKIYEIIVLCRVDNYMFIYTFILIIIFDVFIAKYV